ncbi:pharyngeal muscle protein 2-like isoform X2 [Lutzomyia longipalpis]|nr:pharyngeal muscle protein 2-like isoform X2 [Lutzomyia longipalpis]
MIENGENEIFLTAMNLFTGKFVERFVNARERFDVPNVFFVPYKLAYINPAGRCTILNPQGNVKGGLKIPNNNMGKRLKKEFFKYQAEGGTNFEFNNYFEVTLVTAVGQMCVCDFRIRDPREDVDTSFLDYTAASSEEAPDEPSVDVSEDDPDDTLRDAPDILLEDEPEDVAEQLPPDEPEHMAEDEPEEAAEQQPEDIAEQQPEDIAEQQPEDIAEQQPEDIAEQQPENIAEDEPDNSSDDITDYQAEDIVEYRSDDIS